MTAINPWSIVKLNEDTRLYMFLYNNPSRLSVIAKHLNYSIRDITLITNRLQKQGLIAYMWTKGVFGWYRLDTYGVNIAERIWESE